MSLGQFSASCHPIFLAVRFLRALISAERFPRPETMHCPGPETNALPETRAETRTACCTAVLLHVQVHGLRPSHITSPCMDPCSLLYDHGGGVHAAQLCRCSACCRSSACCLLPAASPHLSLCISSCTMNIHSFN